MLLLLLLVVVVVVLYIQIIRLFKKLQTEEHSHDQDIKQTLSR